MATTVTAVQEVSNTLMSMKHDFAEMLKKTGIDPDKFTRVAILAVQQKPELMQCDKNSLYKAFSDCARDGLIPDGSEAAIVKFGTDAVFMPMVEGLLKLFRNSGECGAIDAAVVFEKDEFDSWVDTAGPHFKHKKSREKDRGKPVLAYAYAITKDGHIYFEEMTEEEIMAVRNVAKTKMVWDGPFKYEMWRKSPLRRLSKRLPKSTDITMALQADDEQYDLTPPTEEPKAESTQSTRLSQAIDAQVVKPEPTQTQEPNQAPDPIPVAAHEPPQGMKTVRGIVLDIRVKTGITAGKPWSRYGGKIENNWYGTFDSKIYDVMSKAKTNRILVDIDYVEVVKDNKVYFECKEIHEVTAGSTQQADGDIPF